MQMGVRPTCETRVALVTLVLAVRGGERNKRVAVGAAHGRFAPGGEICGAAGWPIVGDVGVWAGGRVGGGGLLPLDPELEYGAATLQDCTQLGRSHFAAWLAVDRKQHVVELHPGLVWRTPGKAGGATAEA